MQLRAHVGQYEPGLVRSDPRQNDRRLGAVMLSAKTKGKGFHLGIYRGLIGIAWVRIRSAESTKPSRHFRGVETELMEEGNKVPSTAVVNYPLAAPEVQLPTARPR